MLFSSLPEPSLASEQVLDCLGAIALGIYQSQSLDDILNTAVREVRKLLQTDRVLIYRFQPDESGVVVVESVDSSWTPILSQTIYDPCFTSNWAQAYRQGHFSAIADVYNSDIQPCYLALLAQFQVRANVVVPILQNNPHPKSKIQNPLWGLLIVHHCSDSRQWQPLEVKLLQQIAMQLAIAIGQAKTFEQFQTEQAQRQEAQAELQASKQFLHSTSINISDAYGELRLRKQAEEELRRQQEFLRNVIDTNPNLIWVKDWEGRFTLVNQALADTYGTTIEDLIGKTDADFNSNPAEVEHYLHDDRQVMTSLQPKLIPEEILTSPTGEVHYLQTIKKPLLSPDGKTRYVLATATDITARKQVEQERDKEAVERHRLFEQIEQQNQTLEAKVQERTAQLGIANEQLQQEVAERKQAQEALQKSEQKCRQMAENIQCVVWLSNFAMTQMDYINPAYEKIWGRPCAELYASPQSWLDAVHPEDRDRVMARLAKNRQDENELEYRIVRPDGEIRWIRDRCFPIRDEAGQVYRVVGIAEDISDAYRHAAQRKRAEEALQESNQRIVNILESITNAFFALNREWQFTYLNPQAEQLLQRTREELLGKNIWDEFPESVDSTFYREYHKAISEQVSVAFEEFYLPLNTWFDVHAYPTRDGLAVYFRDINKRKRAEAALRESEARFRRLFESNIVGIIFADFSGRITDANDLFLQMVGYTREELLEGKVRWDEMTPPEYRHLDEQAIEQYKTTRVAASWEKEFIRKDGSRVPVLIGGALLDGFDDYVIAFVLDISDAYRQAAQRKRVEEELRKSEERWQLVVKGNNEGIWDLNLKTNQVFRSARYKEILGYEDYELGNDNEDWVTRIHPDDFERVRQVNRDYLARKIPDYAVEYRLRCKDGSYKWVLGRAQAVWDEAGTSVRMVGSTTDISHRKRAEEALRESEQQFRQIFQEAPIGIALADFQTHRFLQVNPSWCRILGYSVSELIALRFDDITHPDDLPEDVQYVEQIKQGKITSFRMEKRYFNKSGEFMWANLTVTVLPHQDGRPKLLAMIEDITDRKQAEVQIKASLLEKETLLKEIHHRVKNNLQIISSLLRLQSRQIRDRNTDTTRGERQTLELFKESQNRVQAMALIHEKLYQSSNLAQIDFQEYITTLVGNLCRSYDTCRPGVTFKINVEQVSLAIDTAIPCGLIINELVTNSLKYAFSDNQGGEICIRLKLGGLPLNVPVDTERFILTISDNGIGLPEDLDFRNTSSLGLQLVCRLTKQIGGSIELNRSQGTEFNISFGKYTYK